MISKEDYDVIKNALSDCYIVEGLYVRKLTKNKGFFTKRIQYRQSDDTYYLEKDVRKVDDRLCEILKFKKFVDDLTGFVFNGYKIRCGTIVFVLIIQGDGYSYIHRPFSPAPRLFDSLIYSEI